MVLLVSACARPQSRTLALAKKAAEKISDRYEILNLYEENPLPLSYSAIVKRDKASEQKNYEDEMFRFAKKFSLADDIIIAAPYWDLSFPAVLKCYIEAICVNGVTFRYNEMGIPEGLCRAKRLIYITTSGGFIPENNFGYDYIKQLCENFFGIKNTLCIKAEGLDILNADVDGILKSAEEALQISL